MTTVDALSRFVWAHPIEDKSAAGIATILETLFEQESAPETMQLDNSFENHSDTVRLVCQRYNVKLRFNRPYKSQENGLLRLPTKRSSSFCEKQLLTHKLLVRALTLQLCWQQLRACITLRPTV